MTIPADDTRQGLDRLDATLTDAYSQAETVVQAAERRADDLAKELAAAKHQIGILDAIDAGRAHGARRIMNERDQAQQDAERFKADCLAACQTIADMHEAATGRAGMGPIRGVVEDVADVRARAEAAEHIATKNRENAQLLATDARRADVTLQRVRDADTLAQALAAVAEHDGLTPAQAAASAMFAVAAETPAALDAERERDHAIRLAAAEQARDEAVRVADRAVHTLLRIKHAPTPAAAWTELGTYYHLPATEAGRSARAWRTNAERIAERHARRAEADVKEIAEHHDRHRRSVAALFALSADTPFEEITEYAARTLTRGGERLLAGKARADRFEAAWQNARLRAKQSKAREEKANERATHYRDTRRKWLDMADEEINKQRDRADLAEQRAATVQKYVTNAYVEDLAPGVRDDIARILNGQAAEYHLTEV